MLGPLEVRDGAGSPREVSGTRLRALLILLALRTGRVVPASALIDELWPQRLPADAPNALQALVSRLRRAVGDPAAVTSGPAGYQLRVERDDIDVFRFERLAARGRAALAASPGEAAGLLGQALALWRGEPLPDAAETETGRAAIARLTELRLAATEDRVDAELRLGGSGRRRRSPELVAELEGLLAASPTREPLAALLMRALAADGRRGAALQVYERVRGRLADELGADPSPRLAALHLELLRESPPEDSDGGPADVAPPGNLPATLTSFLGREGDLGEVGTLLYRHRLVTLTGPGGAGKTRLAIEAARAVLSGAPAADVSLPGGAWLAELAPVADPADVAVTVLSALGVREQALLITRPTHDVAAADGAAVNGSAAQDVLERLLGALSGRQALLVLDNCEHLIAAAADLADRVLARCPGMRVLATSREPLNITGEALWPVGPLAESPAMRLFVERAAAVSPGFRLTAENSPAVARICQALDGMPLAIELAAARTRAMTPAQIADRLDQRFRLLTGGSRTALPRHQTLRAVVDWSWDLLDDTERALLRRLSVFTGGATLEAAEQVCAGFTGAGPPVAAEDVLDLLTALADKSLVTVRQTPLDGPRYRLLETIREYGRERLADAAETEDVRRRHGAYFLRFTESGQPHLFGADQLDWLRRLGADADNVHLAIRGAVAAGDRQTAIGLVGGFGWFWWLRSMKKEGSDLAALALRDAPSAAQAIDALAAGELAGQAPGEEGWAWLTRLTVAYGMAGMLTMDSPAAAQSAGWLRQAEVLAGRLGPRPVALESGRIPADAGVDFTVAALGALCGPLRAMIESHMLVAPDFIDAVVADPYPWVGALARILRGQIRLNQGRIIDQAEADFRAAAATFEEVGERWGLAMAASSLAQIEEWRLELAAAAVHYEQAADLAGELGTTEDEAQFRLHLARVLWHLGGADRERSRVELARALRDADRLGWPEVTAYAAYVTGTLARLEGDLVTAKERLDEAARVAESYRGGLTQISAVTYAALGYLAADEGDLAAASSWHDRALASALPTGDSPVIAEVLTGMADTAVRGGDALRAVTLLGAAEGVRGTRDRSDDDEARVSAAARALLSPADYSAAFRRGQAVTLPTLAATLAELGPRRFC
jgi:predicted ATPase/DNA-binding SARP family transcriptional activator